MNGTAPTPSLILAHVEATRKTVSDATVFGIHASGRWLGDTIQPSSHGPMAVYQCDSPLQIRLALQESQAPATVVITPLDSSELSDDILARFAQRKLRPINPWEILRSRFGARQIDPRIARYPWMANLLLESIGSQPPQPVSGGFLDAEMVWDLLFRERLSLETPRPDLPELLRWTANSRSCECWRALDPSLKEAATDWICGTSGEVGRFVLKSLESAHAQAAVAIGLVMDVVFHPSASRELERAAGRLEAMVGMGTLSNTMAQRWADAARDCVAQLEPALGTVIRQKADQLLEQIGASNHAYLSDELPHGFELRFARYGSLLAKAVTAKACPTLKAVYELAESIQKHHLAVNDTRRVERVRMAGRLLRWCIDASSKTPDRPATLPACVQDYVDHGAFVDWARQVIRGGEANTVLSKAYVRLLNRVTEARERQNQYFGELLQSWEGSHATCEDLIPVEKILDEVVVRAANAAPVLLLVMDGMSHAVFRELVADITRQRWSEITPEGRARRWCGLAAFPSVTQVCRASLLTGKRQQGDAGREAKGFAEHRGLAEAGGVAPRLFHKATLEGDEDTSLAAELREALASDRQRVVGIVINAVDDHLEKGDQADPIWTTQYVRALAPILAEADSAGRLVVLASDHGHVIDRQTTYRKTADGERWRRPEAALEEGELLIESRRVVIPEGGRVVVPWTETLRYGKKKQGYHGGVSPQEMLIPITLLWSQFDVPNGYAQLAVDTPGWWSDPQRELQAVPQLPVLTGKVGTPSLFEPAVGDDQGRPRTAPAWLDALFASEIYQVQKSLAGRKCPAEPVVRGLLETLITAGGSLTATALASAIRMPRSRVSGLLALVERVLNVEGYTVLDQQAASETISLNVDLLKTQFELN